MQEHHGRQMKMRGPRRLDQAAEREASVGGRGSVRMQTEF